MTAPELESISEDSHFINIEDMARKDTFSTEVN